MPTLGRSIAGAVHQLARSVEVEGVTAAGVAAAGDRAGLLAVRADVLVLGRQAGQAEAGKHLLGTRALLVPAENSCKAQLLAEV